MTSDSLVVCGACRGSGDRHLTTCPGRVIDASAWTYIRMANFAERGVLPDAGALRDQTCRDVAAMELVWHEQAKHRDAQLEKARKRR